MLESSPMSQTLLAGAAQVDITPQPGTQIAGDIGRYRPAELTLDPIFARALVLESEGTRLCLLSLDILATDDEWTERIRHSAAEQYGFDPDAVLVHNTQTHAAPSIGHHIVSRECDLVPPGMEWIRGGDDAYNPFALERILQAIGQAQEALTPVSLGVGRSVESRVAFNRRFVMRDGTGRCHPGAAVRDEILYCEGPIDPEVGVVCFTGESLQTVAMILHHTCHPVHGYPKRYVSAGWPGAWCRQMAQFDGPGVVPMVLNGCCGNIHHSNHLNPHHVDDPETAGRNLAETARGVLERLGAMEPTPLAYKSARVGLPREHVPEEALKQARDLVQRHPEPMWKDDSRTAIDWAWCHALRTLDMQRIREQEPEYDYLIQAFRIGDLAMLGLGGEPFVESQLRIKRESPAAFTFVGHMSTGFVGYLPTPEAIANGGYEAEWHTLAPEALDIVTEASIGLLRELFGD